MKSHREYPDRPVPSAGGIVLREWQGRVEVLLVRRNREPMAGTWSLPGGVIETGETARDACVREVLEETGLKVRPIVEVETFELIVHDHDGRVQYHYLIVDWLCHVLGGEMSANSDAGEALWADTQAVIEHGDFALTPHACTVIRKALIMDEGRS